MSPAYSSKEAEQMRIPDELALVVAHGLDELVEPNGRICAALVSVRFLMARSSAADRPAAPGTMHVCSPTASFFPCNASMLMRLPTGSSSCQRLLTPIVQGASALEATLASARKDGLVLIPFNANEHLLSHLVT